MFTAVFIVHADDPWEDKEFAFLYMVIFLAIALMGGGKWTLDRFFKKN